MKQGFNWIQRQRNKNKLSTPAIMVVLGVACIGIYALIVSHAASPYASIEAESGSLQGGASIQHDTSASGGSYVQFASSPLYKVSGNQILDAGGAAYIPLGVTVFGLAKDVNQTDSNDNNWAQWPTSWQAAVISDKAQIDASASYWHSNIVRLQVSPFYLQYNPGDGQLNTTNQTYLSDIETEVKDAEADNLNVILSAQYEETDGIYPLHGPNSSTDSFWKIIAPIYANDTHVWFDLYNEPTGDKGYPVWKNGGTVNSVTYVGMQQLVDDVRAAAPNNIILAESIDDSSHLEGFTGYTLSGGNIVYSVHPYFNNDVVTSPEPASWWEKNEWAPAWGDFASTYPIIIGEWGEHEGNDVQCQPNAQALVEGDVESGVSYPGLLQYMSSLHLGLIGWSLTPGAMIDGTNLDKPNSFTDPATYSCSTNPPNDQGTGADILKYFEGGGNY